jgi:hypothetical protein
MSQVDKIDLDDLSHRTKSIGAVLRLASSIVIKQYSKYECQNRNAIIIIYYYMYIV